MFEVHILNASKNGQSFELFGIFATQDAAIGAAREIVRDRVTRESLVRIGGKQIRHFERLRGREGERDLIIEHN